MIESCFGHSRRVNRIVKKKKIIIIRRNPLQMAQLLLHPYSHACRMVTHGRGATMPSSNEGWARSLHTLQYIDEGELASENMRY